MAKNRIKNKTKITVSDFIKAVKKADREIQLDTNIGFQATTKVHKSKKVYDRNRSKNNIIQEQ